MSAHTNRRRLSAALLVSSLLLLIGAVVASQVSNAPSASANDVDPNCATSVHFYSMDVENNFFGPASDGDVDAQKKELHTRRCQDPALTTAHAHTWNMSGFAELNGDEQFAAKTRELIADPVLWRTTVKAIEDQENGSVATIETMSGSYETLYMLDGVTDVPLIRKAEPDRPEFQVIRFSSIGGTVNFKLDCGFQPVGQFPNIPPVDAPPPPHQPPPGPPPTIPSTTTTKPGETTTTTTPETTTTTVCLSGKCVPPTTKAAPPTTQAPPPTSPTTLPPNDSGPGAYNTIPPRDVPTTIAPPAPPPSTIAPPTTRVEF